MDFDSEFVKKYFGENYDKAKRNYNNELNTTKTKLTEKYPYAKVFEFEFWVNISKSGEINNGTNIIYRADGKTKLYNNTMTMWKYEWDIKSSVFRTKYEDALHWGQRIWEPSETVQPFLLSRGVLPFTITQFEIFVNEQDSFQCKFETINTKWTNAQNAKDITKMKIDKEEPYFSSLLSAYIISQKSGIQYCSEIT